MTKPDEAHWTMRTARPVARVLVGTSLAPEDAAVLHAAATIARKLRASLSVVHAIEPIESWMLAAAPTPTTELRARIVTELERLAAPGLASCEITIRPGAPHRVLDEEARRVGADLVVIGATAGGVTRMLGSTADRLVRKARVPVLVVRGRELAIPPRRVLAPVDLSTLSADGFHCGLGLLSQLAAGASGGPGGPVDVLAMIAIGYLDPLAEEMRERRWTLDELTELAHDRLEDLVEGHPADPSLRVECRVVLGAARDEILGAARATDLVVMSTHGRGGFERWVLGSVASTVVREAPCSVLLVPPDAAFGDAVAQAVMSQTAPFDVGAS
jgi:nucleotide-binding universal stress UspA family protein